MSDPIKVINICDVPGLDDVPYMEGAPILKAYCSKHDAHHYSAPRCSFNMRIAVDEARELGKSAVVVEDLS